MVGRTPLAINHSTIADEQGAQQACNSTLSQPSGIKIAGCFNSKLLLLTSYLLLLTSDILHLKVLLLSKYDPWQH